jgi:hypothetical protein
MLLDMKSLMYCIFHLLKSTATVNPTKVKSQIASDRCATCASEQSNWDFAPLYNLSPGRHVPGMICPLDGASPYDPSLTRGGGGGGWRRTVEVGGRAYSFVFSLAGTVCWPLLCLCRPRIFERCLDSNQESCRSKQVLS